MKVNTDTPIGDLSACLFPHSLASEREIERILSFFDTVTIFQPWHMEDRFSIPRGRGLEAVHPPEHLKPVDRFQSLLSEYKNWIRQHPEKGYASAISATREYGKRDDATWEIRRSIRRQGEKQDRAKISATRWHLLLHLARENEERLREAGEVLKVLKEKGSPLRDAIGEGEPQGMLDDLSYFDAEREMEEEVAASISEAWHGLFGGLIDENAVFVTLSRPFFETLSALWSEHLSEEDAREDAERFASIRVSLKDNKQLREFKDAVRGMRMDPIGQMKVLRMLIEGLESDTPREGEEILRFRMRFFAPNTRTATRMEALRGLSGRLLFLLEDSSRE